MGWRECASVICEVVVWGVSVCVFVVCRRWAWLCGCFPGALAVTAVCVPALSVVMMGACVGEVMGVGAVPGASLGERGFSASAPPSKNPVLFAETAAE